MKYKIFPLGDNALTVDFGNQISAESNDRVLQLAHFFDKRPFSGLIEMVPAYASLTCFYNVLAVRKNFPEFPTAFEAVKHLTEMALQNSSKLKKSKQRLVEIPVCFIEEYAPDLEFVARLNHLSVETVIKTFLSGTYRVYMLGFLPGFSYMGEVDRKIAAPRKPTPRVKVPRGSVGIANRQTGIYSFSSPGGWQIIGKTNVELFTPYAETPTFLQAGDTVKFYETKF